jgi:WD40 repeat protein
LDSLLDAKLPKEVKERLNNLPKGSGAYSHAYQGIMKRVERQGPKSVEFAKSVLSWVTCAKRPLIISELQHALAVEIGSHEFNQEHLPHAQDLISVCAGLVSVDEDNNTIRLFHYTAQEYFEQTRNQWFPDAENDITKVCITYLSFDIFETGFSSTDTAFEERLKSYQLYDYAAHNWGHHARESSALDQLVLDFFTKKTKVEASSQALFADKKPGKLGYSQDVPHGMRGLHLAAYFGIKQVLQSPFDLYGWDPKDGFGRTPLSWAAENGHEAVVRILLGKGANSKAKDHSSLTPLSWAAMSGHETIIQLLDTSSQSQLDAIADAAKRKLQKFNLMQGSLHMIRESDQNKKEQQRLYHEAETINTQLGQIKDRRKQIDDELRKLQMEKEILSEEEINKAGEVHNLSQMQVNAEEKQEQLSKLWIFVQKKIDELRQMDGETNEHDLEQIRDVVLFRWAVEDGYAMIVESLLCGGTDATTTHEDGWVPLHTAANKGHVDIVELLIDVGKVRVGFKDKNGQTALQLAAEKGHQDIIHLLLKKGAVVSQCQQTFKGHTSAVASVALSYDSKLVASGSWDDTVKLWDTATGKCQRTFKGHKNDINSVAFSHNSKLIASASDDKSIKIWDTATGKCQWTFKGHTDWVSSVAFSHNSKLVASGAKDYNIKLWDITTGKCRQTLKGHSIWINSVAFSYNSKLIASGSDDGSIKIWDTTTGKCRKTLEDHMSTGCINSVAFSHDSKLIVSGLSTQILKLWDIAMGKCQWIFKGHTDWVSSVAFSHNSKVIASGSLDGTVKLWDTATGECRQTLEGHKGPVYSVAFSHNLKLIVSGLQDNEVGLWDIARAI